MPDSPIKRLLDFEAQAGRDQQQSAAFLHRRDRRFALDCHEQGESPDPAHWLAHMNRLSGNSPRQSGARALARWRRIHVGFALAGTILGLLTMPGLLFYEGGERINVTLILAFVLLQCLLALLTTLQSIAGWQPWRWLLARAARDTATGALHHLHPQLMARAAHLGGLCFGLAGLIMLLVMVVVQDLAFGWSTTLNTAATSYHQLLEVLAGPWRWLWPAAVPDLQLVEATRFFRAEEIASLADPRAWGEWWPFVAMVWLFYVIAPRLVLLVLAHGLLQRRARRALNRHPAMTALQYRMETPILDTGNQSNDAADLPDLRTSATLAPLPQSHVLIQWAGAGQPALPDALVRDRSVIASAGGQASLSEDQQTIESARPTLENQRLPAVILVTRSWEPPTGELLDFLQQATDYWPDRTHIALVPLAPDPTGHPEQHQLDQWVRFAERVPGNQVSVCLPDLPALAPHSHPRYQES